MNCIFEMQNIQNPEALRLWRKDFALKFKMFSGEVCVTGKKDRVVEI